MIVTEEVSVKDFFLNVSRFDSHLFKKLPFFMRDWRFGEKVIQNDMVELKTLCLIDSQAEGML